MILHAISNGKHEIATVPAASRLEAHLSDAAVNKYANCKSALTAHAKQIFKTWMAKSKGDRVFTREDGVSPVSAFTLIQQQERMRQLLNLPSDACVHSARHTALTNLGLTGVDPFTLQRAAGHANISTTRKYVHPTPRAMADAFQKKVQSEQRDRQVVHREQSRRKQRERALTLASPVVGMVQ
ncbi:MAG TPA: tyrosine-type recombinase/integrase [Terriglobales bacterium]|nr:tyrosine-type recombinase/integrase [Terriglobales bacterium]